MSTAPGWYYAQGDAPGTTRYWDGTQWVGDPVATPSGPASASYGEQPGGRSELASAGSRIGARIIDFIIQIAIALAFLWSSISEFFDRISDLPAGADNDDVQAIVEDVFSGGTTGLLLGTLAAFVWEWLWIAFAGGTPGKLMLGIRVSDASSGRVPPNLVQAAMRSINRLIPLIGVVGVGLANAATGIGSLIGLVSLIMLFADDRHRTVMDHIARTLVVRK